ncbi:hypothetical protein ACL9RF_13530 [Sphingobacterium sp. Mn56C]|uniref:hypothetical protein n=1 Tax=Sphingobacterium sp. Mn56C TaxID=3395261 RepID=UPI003BCF9108
MKEKDTYNECSSKTILPDSLRQSSFVVPENFFIEQQQHILNEIKLPAIQDITTSVLPDDYFDQLSQTIQNKIAEDRLKDLIPKDGFSIPTGFEAHLQQSILAEVAEVKLKQNVAEDGFATADNYFSTSAAQLMTQIKVHDWKKQENPFTVPNNYWHTLENNILGAINPASSDAVNTPKIVPLAPKRNWINYISGAAAAVMLLMGAAVYFMWQQTAAVTEDSLQFASLSAADAADNVPTLALQNISDEDLVNYLAQVSEGEDLMHLAKFMVDNSDDSIHLDNKVENEDIEEYLNYML